MTSPTRAIVRMQSDSELGSATSHWNPTHSVTPRSGEANQLDRVKCLFICAGLALIS